MNEWTDFHWQQGRRHAGASEPLLVVHPAPDAVASVHREADGGRLVLVEADEGSWSSIVFAGEAVIGDVDNDRALVAGEADGVDQVVVVAGGALHVATVANGVFAVALPARPEGVVEIERRTASAVSRTSLDV